MLHSRACNRGITKYGGWCNKSRPMPRHLAMPLSVYCQSCAERLLFASFRPSRNANIVTREKLAGAICNKKLSYCWSRQLVLR